MSNELRASPNQAYALSLAVYGAYRAGWNGDVRKRSTRPYLKPSERFFRDRSDSGAMMRGPRVRGGGFLISPQTFQSLVAKGLVDGGTGKLTKKGILAGEERYEKDHGRTAEQGADAHMLEDQAKEQAVQDKIARAKHLFRGFKVTRKVDGSKKVSDAIARNGLPNNYFWLDDLIAVGEEIEKLR
jgi:hypothetical protein